MFGLNNYAVLVIVYVSFGSSFYGYDSGITTSVIAYESFISYFALNANTIGAFNSAYYAACALGNFMNLYLPDRYGRLRTIQFACINNVFAVVLQTAAVNYGMFVAGRILGGISCGIVFAICPTYAAEISPPAIRGRVGMINALNQCFGYFVTEWLGLAFYFIGGQASWRVLFGLQIVPTILMGVGSFWMPESPRWLALVGRFDETLAVLKRMHEDVRANEATEANEEEFYKREYKQIKAQIELDKAEHLGLKDILRKPSYRRRLLLVVNFFLFTQLTGIIPIQNYQTIIYRIAGLSEVLTLTLVGVWGTWILGSVFVMSWWFDRIGRRKSLFLSYSCIITGSLITVIAWARFEAAGSKDISVGAGIIVGMFIFVWGWGGTLNTFAAVYVPEIMPTCIRAAGVSCGYAIFNIVIIVLVQITPLAIESISWRYFMIFIICDVVYVVGFYFFYPETKGKTLEEIEAIFGDKVADFVQDSDVNVASPAEKSVANREHVEVGKESAQAHTSPMDERI